MMIEKLENLYFSYKYPRWLVQFIYLLYNLHLETLQDYERSDIFLPHRLEKMLEQTREKTITFLTTAGDKKQIFQKNGYKQKK